MLGIFYTVLSGALASGLGYAIWYAALPGLTATKAASIQLSVPVVTALAGAALLGEMLTMRLTISSLVVLGGIGLVIAGRFTRSLRGPACRTSDTDPREHHKI